MDSFATRRDNIMLRYINIAHCSASFSVNKLILF